LKNLGGGENMHKLILAASFTALVTGSASAAINLQSEPRGMPEIGKYVSAPSTTPTLPAEVIIPPAPVS
jgi:hypothetical protein